MSRFANPVRYSAVSFTQLGQPLTKIPGKTPQLESRYNRPLQMTFEDQLNALIFFHLEEHTPRKAPCPVSARG